MNCQKRSSKCKEVLDLNVRPIQKNEQIESQLLTEQNHFIPDISLQQTFVLEKDKAIIGYCQFHPSCQSDLPYHTAQIHCIYIEPQWQGKGYGSYLLKQVLHHLGAFKGTDIYAWLSSSNVAANRLFSKFGFLNEGTTKLLADGKSVCLFLRSTPKQLTSLTVSHELLASRIHAGDFVIDATAGLGRDTAYLCRLVGKSGKVLAMDIQQKAVDATNSLLQQKGLSDIGTAILANHANLADYASPHSVDAIVFNFGWLPSGNHAVFTTPQTSIPALEAALTLLKPRGFIVASIYHGGVNGTEEKDTLLPWFAALDSRHYTVLQCSFANREGKDPIVLLVQAH